MRSNTKSNKNVNERFIGTDKKGKMGRLLVDRGSNVLCSVSSIHENANVGTGAGDGVYSKWLNVAAASIQNCCYDCFLVV